MNRKQTISMLVEFLSGDLGIDEFRHQLDDILFDLRQDAGLNEFRQLLSKIQLYIHELHEGNRDIHEVYIAAQAAIDSIKPLKK